MKLNLQLADADNFMRHQHMIGEHEVTLVQPVHIGCDWTRENEVFRSVVVDAEGEIVSASFKKFPNWGEKSHLWPVPTNLANANLIEKLDGSTLIFSRYKGHTIIRTRGTVDARKQDNGYEIDILCEKYAGFIKWFETMDTIDASYIFEWLSPSNKIVLNYGDEPDMVLTAVIRHHDYSYVSQLALDALAALHDLRRPKTYSYNSVAEMQQAITDMKGVEGICVYFHNDQEILKVKSAQYLYLHRAKSDIASIEKVIDLYLDFMFGQRLSGEKYGYTEFFSYLEKTYDYEIATMAQGHVSRICDAMKEVEVIFDAMVEFVRPLYFAPRKDAAEKILQAYGTTGRSAIVFKMLDRKTIVADDYKKLLFQCLKA